MAQLRELVGGGLPAALPAARPPRPAPGRRSAPASRRDPSPAIVRRRIRAETRGVIVAGRRPGVRPLRRGAAAPTASTSTSTCSARRSSATTRPTRGSTPLRDRIARPDVDYVSVKISALCAGLDVLAFDHEVARIADRLRAVYDAAAAQRPAGVRQPRHGGVPRPPPDRRRLHDACSTSRRTAGLRAGIVLQAYLPDTHDVARRARSRGSPTATGAGGAPVKVRLVKGANLAMEHVDAELGGWTPAPYATKAEVDASYKRAARPPARRRAATAGLHVGVASHNLFDVAWALGAVRRPRRSTAAVEIEMLEGMAPPQARADARRGRRPAALHAGRHRRGLRRQHRLPVAPARRERRAGELPALAVHDRARTRRRGTAERRRFEQSVADRARRRTHAPPGPGPHVPSSATFDPDAPFANEPDTDFTQAANRAWIAAPPAPTTGRPSRRRCVDDDRRRSTTSSRRAAPGAERVGGDDDGRAARRAVPSRRRRWPRSAAARSP